MEKVVKADDAAPAAEPASPPTALSSSPRPPSDLPTAPPKTVTAAATAAAATSTANVVSDGVSADADVEAAPTPLSPTQSPDDRLQALERKTAKWKEAVAVQLNDAARKNKKLREELRVVREEKETALSALRVQLTEEFQERTLMQREELAELTKLAAALREEKKSMAAAHEAELQKTRVQLREVIQLEVETRYKRKEEQWEKEKAALQTRAEAKETERAQAEHEGEVLKVRLSRLGAQYEELASLLQPKGEGGSSPTHSPTSDHAKSSGADGAGGPSPSGADPARQQNAVNAAFTQQIESIKAELQSKEQHTQFVLDRARQEHEAEKAQLLRELQLREEELKVAHTLLKQVQADSSGYLQRVSHAQTERQAMEQRYAAKVAALSEELAGRLRVVDEAQAANRRLQEQLRTAQQQVAMLEEESTMREEAFHSLMLSEDNKRLVMDLQRAVQAARDEAEQWKLQYYTALSSQPSSGGPADGAATNQSRTSGVAPTAATAAVSAGGNGAVNATGDGKSGRANAPTSSGAASNSTPQVWQEQLAAKEAALEAQAAQLERKAHLLEAAEAKLNDMRRSMASQASLLLQQQKTGGRRGGGGRGGGDGAGSERVVFHEGGGEGDELNTGAGSDAEDDDADAQDMLNASPIISTAASVLPTFLHGPLRTLEAERRQLLRSGTWRDLSRLCCSSSNNNTNNKRGAPAQRRRIPMLVILVLLMFGTLTILLFAITR